jgi:antitoxin component YwqK of YwqJK toxin-antitoxin module
MEDIYNDIIIDSIARFFKKETIDILNIVNKKFSRLIMDNKKYLCGLYGKEDINYYSDGTLKSNFFSFDGRAHGQQRIWYNSNLLMSISNFKNGKKHGLQEGWFGNGNISYKYTV